MQHGHVTHGNPAADVERDAFVGVQHGAVLNVGAGADGDEIVVAADNCVEPDAHVVVKNYGAYEGGVGSDEVIVATDFHLAVSQGMDHSNLLSSDRGPLHLFKSKF